MHFPAGWGCNLLAFWTFVTLFSQAGEAPVRQALRTAGRASVKESLTSDDSNCRNDPGQIMNVWVVPRDFELKWLCPWSLADFGELLGPHAFLGAASTGLGLTRSVLGVSYHPGQRSAWLAFLGLKWKGSGSSFSLQPSKAIGALFWNVKQSFIRHCLRHHPAINVKDDLIDPYKSP